MAQLWGGRFTKSTDQLVYDFNASISFDRRFFHQDVEGSMAHVKMLANKGIMGVSSKIDAPIFVFLKYFLYLCSEGE